MREYVLLKRGARSAFVWRKDADVIADALFEGCGSVASELGGRGEMLRFSWAEGTGLIRTCLRGGAIRHVLKDAYILHNRPLREFQLHVRLFEQGLDVPRPLGVLWGWRGIVFRGSIATQEVDAVNLCEYLRGAPAAPEETLRRCGALIRRMHDLNVFHPDLQVRNVLVAGDKPYLIDFDKAEIVRNMTLRKRGQNLFRFRRSLEKNGLDTRYFETVCEGYGGGAPPRWLDRLYEAKGRASDWLSGRETCREAAGMPLLRHERHGMVRAHLRDGVSFERVFEALTAPHETLKCSRKSETFRVGAWVVKRSCWQWGLGVIKHTALRGRYRQGWHAANYLLDHGVCVPAPIAYVEASAMGIIFGNAFVCEYLDGFRNIEQHAVEFIKPSAPEIVSRFFGARMPFYPHIAEFSTHYILPNFLRLI